MYSYLHQKQRALGPNSGLTIGAKNQNAPFIIPHLTKQMPGRLRVSPLHLFRYRLPRLLTLVRDLRESGVTHLQFYDGGLLELLISLELARQNPGLIVVYNFHWADEWLRLFQRRGLVPTWLRTQIYLHLSNRPRNLIISAETSKLAHRLALFLGFTPETYPIMSLFDPPLTKPWRERTTDLLVIPQRAGELAFVAGIVAMATRSKRTAKVLLSEGLRDQFQPTSEINVNPRDLLLGTLESRQFIETLADAKLVILPYDKPYFAWGSSGKFNEAIALGAFPFAPSATALGYQSSLSPRLHSFELNDLEKAWGAFTARLEAGIPEGLLPTTYKTFMNWLASFELAQNRSLVAIPQGSNLVLWATALLYRSDGPGIIRQFRARFGSKIDRFGASLMRFARVARQRGSQPR